MFFLFEIAQLIVFVIGLPDTFSSSDHIKGVFVIATINTDN